MSQETNELTDMIDEMLDGYMSKEEPTDPEPVEAENAEPEEEVTPVEEPEPEKAEPEKESEVQAEADGAKDAEPDGEVEVSEIDELRKQNELLQQRLNEAYVQRETPPAQQSPVEDKKPDYFEGWKYEDIIDNEDAFKKFLGEFAEKIRGYTEETLSRKLPSQVSQISSDQYALQKRVENFYEQHQALDRVRPFVAQITGQVAKENPSWNIDKVLEETAKRSYEALGLNKEVKKDVKQVKKPAFASTKKAGPRGQDPEPQLSDQEKEILDLIEF